MQPSIINNGGDWFNKLGIKDQAVKFIVLVEMSKIPEFMSYL